MNRSARRALRCIALVAALSAGCGGESSPTPDTAGDAPADVPTEAADAIEEVADIPAELPLPDADPDVAADLPADGTGTDAVSDVPPDVPTDTPPQDAEPDVPVGPPYRVSTSFDARASVEQVHVRTAIPATVLQVIDADGGLVAEGTVDEWGSLVFRNVPPGRGYSVRPASDPADYTGPLTVLSVEGSLPPDSFYESQVLQPGFGYLTTRDGTKLSYFLTLPGPPEEGPYPTVVSYSGYSPSRPGHVLSSQIEGFCPDYPILCNAPDDPSNLVAALLGFATLGVNMRGTGCSDGAYDYFEPLQTLDGYDVVEIAARQPWVLDHEVGMVGLSFPGIGQLFVAAARPPSLVAIAPQSVIADSASSCLAPGGIYNDGFAKNWHDMVLNAAVPYHHGWVKDVIAAGDTLCDAHQKMHGQQRDAIEEALDHLYYDDEIAKPVDPSAWVDRIQVPVLMTGQWQDEQTGPHFAALLDRFTGAPDLRAVVTNGFHNDGFAPERLTEWMEFIQLFVAKQVPTIPGEVQAMGSFFMQEVFGAALAFGESDLASQPDLASALSAWRARPRVRVLFDTGNAPGTPAGSPQSAFEASFAAWPVPATVADRWRFQPGGAMSADAPPADGGASTFVHDPDAGQRTQVTGSVYANPPNWTWRNPDAGKAVAFVSAPLAADRVMIGHASADLWIRTDATDVDLEVTLSEVRPDGDEVYVQGGWLRAGHRALRSDATELRPIHTFRFEDYATLPAGEWTLVRVEVMPFAHAFRAGSRIRVAVDTPGDSRAEWRFRTLAYDTPPAIELGHDAAHPSGIALPLVPGVDVPTDLPACGTLRGQPCREYLPAANGG